MIPLEYTTTRHNPAVDPVLEAWRIEVPIDLFAAALAGGLMVLAGVQLLLTRPSKPQPAVTCTIGPLIGLALLSLGLTALFLDLSHKLHVWRLYATLQYSSPMSWGSYLMLLSYAALLVNAIAHLPQSIPTLTLRFPLLAQVSDHIFAQRRIVPALGAANLVLGCSLGIYTGTLLSTMRARPLWNSPLLGPIFLVSGLAAAAAVLHAVHVLSGTHARLPRWQERLLARIARWTGAARPSGHDAAPLQWATVILLALQLAVIGLFLVGKLTSPEVSQHAVMALIDGRYAFAFWGAVVVLGTGAPLFLHALELRNVVRRTILPAVLVVLGAFMLRYVLVFAGQESHWVRSIAGN